MSHIHLRIKKRILCLSIDEMKGNNALSKQQIENSFQFKHHSQKTEKTLKTKTVLATTKI